MGSLDGYSCSAASLSTSRSFLFFGLLAPHNFTGKTVMISRISYAGLKWLAKTGHKIYAILHMFT
jgi:hypothetical protein